MNPLILSLICLVLVGVSANLIKIIRENRLLLILSLIPCAYILVYGIYITLGPIDLYEDGTKNYFLKNPDEKELPIVFVLLKFYQYILMNVGAVFGFIYFNYIKKIKDTSEPSD